MYLLDLFKKGSHFIRLEVEGGFDEAIEKAIAVMGSHQASSARLSKQDGEVVWRGYAQDGPGGCQ